MGATELMGAEGAWQSPQSLSQPVSNIKDLSFVDSFGGGGVTI